MPQGIPMQFFAQQLTVSLIDQMVKFEHLDNKNTPPQKIHM